MMNGTIYIYYKVLSAWHSCWKIELAFNSTWRLLSG